MKNTPAPVSKSPPVASYSQGELAKGWTLFLELPLDSVDRLLKKLDLEGANRSDTSRKMSRNNQTSFCRWTLSRAVQSATDQDPYKQNHRCSFKSCILLLLLHSLAPTLPMMHLDWRQSGWGNGYGSIGDSTPPHYFLQPQLTQLDLETLKLKVYAPTPVSTLWCLTIMFFKQLRWENSYEANYYSFTKRLFHTGSLNTDS